MQIKVIGIGLPRTGSTSLSECLGILGYAGEHYCEIFGSINSQYKNNKKYIINNSYYKNIEEVILNNKNSKFILTTRNDAEWEKSIKKFININKLIYPSIYEDKVYNIFLKNNILNNLLIINLFDLNEINKWKNICYFLNENIPNKPFPHIKLEKK
jgi:hypothetical protein